VSGLKQARAVMDQHAIGIENLRGAGEAVESAGDAGDALLLCADALPGEHIGDEDRKSGVLRPSAIGEIDGEEDVAAKGCGTGGDHPVGADGGNGVAAAWQKAGEIAD